MQQRVHIEVQGASIPAFDVDKMLRHGDARTEESENELNAGRTKTNTVSTPQQSQVSPQVSCQCLHLCKRCVGRTVIGISISSMR